MFSQSFLQKYREGERFLPTRASRFAPTSPFVSASLITSGNLHFVLWDDDIAFHVFFACGKVALDRDSCHIVGPV